MLFLFFATSCLALSGLFIKEFLSFFEDSEIILMLPLKSDFKVSSTLQIDQEERWMWQYTSFLLMKKNKRAPGSSLTYLPHCKLPDLVM